MKLYRYLFLLPIILLVNTAVADKYWQIVTNITSPGYINVQLRSESHIICGWGLNPTTAPTNITGPPPGPGVVANSSNQYVCRFPNPRRCQDSGASATVIVNGQDKQGRTINCTITLEGTRTGAQHLGLCDVGYKSTAITCQKSSVQLKMIGTRPYGDVLRLLLTPKPE